MNQVVLACLLIAIRRKASLPGRAKLLSKDGLIQPSKKIDLNWLKFQKNHSLLPSVAGI